MQYIILVIFWLVVSAFVAWIVNDMRKDGLIETRWQIVLAKASVIISIPAILVAIAFVLVYAAWLGAKNIYAALFY